MEGSGGDFKLPFHILHGFWVGRGTATDTLKSKLLQQLAAMEEEFLFVIFLDLTKAYEALDRSRCLDILEGYGVGPSARRLLTTYWCRLTMVARAGGYYSSLSVTSWRWGRRRSPPGYPGTWTCPKPRTL